MSFSFSYIGTPKAICQAMDRYYSQSDPGGQAEMDKVVPGIKAALLANYNVHFPPIMRVDASGHGSSAYGTCFVKVEPVNAVLVMIEAETSEGPGNAPNPL